MVPVALIISLLPLAVGLCWLFVPGIAHALVIHGLWAASIVGALVALLCGMHVIGLRRQLLLLTWLKRPVSRRPTLLRGLKLLLPSGQAQPLSAASLTPREAQKAIDTLADRLETQHDVVRYGRLLYAALSVGCAIWAVSRGFMDIAYGLGQLPASAATATFLGTFQSLYATMPHLDLWFFSAGGLALLGFCGVVCLAALEAQTHMVSRRCLTGFEDWVMGFMPSTLPPLKPSLHEGAHPLSPAYPSAVLSALVESMETLNGNLVKQDAHHRELFGYIQDLSDRIGSLTDQARTEQHLMVKLAEGQLTLQHTLQKFQDAALEGDLGFDKISKGYIKSMSRTLQQLAELIHTGGLTKDLRHELRILSKTMGGLPMPTPPQELTHELRNVPQ